MKRYLLGLFVIVIFLTNQLLGAIEKGVTVDKADGTITFYYNVTGDDLAAEASTLVWSKNFSGTLYDVLVIADTQESDIQVILSLNPPEAPEATQLTTATSFFTLTYTTAGFYVIPISDSSSNVYGGVRMSGKIYMQVKNALKATTNSVRVYVFGKLN